LSPRLVRNYIPSFRRRALEDSRELVLARGPGRLVIGQGGDEVWG